MNFEKFAFTILYRSRDTAALSPQFYHDSHRAWHLCVHLIYIYIYIYIILSLDNLENIEKLYVILYDIFSYTGNSEVSFLPVD